ncbi:VanZ family protein [Nocardioides sp. IC4_145]|uniref:VanZ family protein n=1 Tax=Nocardioides sp. IC4_145 TaxID=2714037 RepID=UPI00140866DE|nr:VanZ family protein [Nocardioides sp. IC4_145]NHC24190.1 VanZ family protein [Nocardioides sp. IC4_145]
MDPWVWPAYVGVVLGTSALLLLLVPILAYQYRRYGQFTPRRALGAAAVSVYGTSQLAYTFLPLPDSRGDWCATAAASPQWRPLHFITDIADAAAGAGPLQLLSSRVTLQVLFNLVLFVPWGLMVRGFWGRSAAFATWSGFLASVVIESTQLTGVWGIYHCAYRVGDVDDLIVNTLGALIGAVLAPWVCGGCLVRGPSTTPDSSRGPSAAGGDGSAWRSTSPRSTRWGSPSSSAIGSLLWPRQVACPRHTPSSRQH